MRKIWKVVKILGITYVILEISGLAVHGAADFMMKAKAANEDGPIENLLDFLSDILTEDIDFIKKHSHDDLYYTTWF